MQLKRNNERLKNILFPFKNKTMKIAYVMYPGACFMGDGDGTKMQANIWKDGLTEKGHEVALINPWQKYNWKDFDVVHAFGLGLWNYDFVHWGSRLNPNFVFSPIIDSNTPLWAYKIASRIGIKKLRLYSQNYSLRLLKNDFKLFYVRSNYEAAYLKAYGIPEERIVLVPLTYRFDTYTNAPKEPFCLFAGTMTQPRKNVKSLIEAAKKYKFKLVLVGNTGNEESRLNLQNQIGNAENIEIKGFVSEEELLDLYNRAKVFALPSLNEGVGLVALEAAVCGCDIVITNLGGPKEYYNGLAFLVNPHSVDEIGAAINKAMKEENSLQPQLRNHLIENYNPEKCLDLLIKSYETLGG